MNRWLLWAAVLAAAACQRLQPAPAASPTAAPPDPVQEGRALLDQGQLDAALAKLEGAPASADACYYQGLVWLRRSETAPLPTPVPGAAGDPRHVLVPEFKQEELKALELFEKAVALDPRHGGAHLAAADLLAAHAVRRHEEAVANPRRGRRPSATPPPAEGEPALDADRILASYRAAVDADPSTRPAESLIRFAQRMGRLEDARSGYEELIRRDNENPQPRVQFGDFLVSQLKDRGAAIEAYRQALIWRPDDEATRSKLADIYIAMGMEHYARQEWAAAQARFAEAEKYVTDRNSPQGLKIQDHQNRLREIRRPR